MDKTLHQTALCGSIPIMPSKSASHRAVMMAALCGGTTELAPLQLSRDIEATLACAGALGLTAASAILPLCEEQGTVTASITGGIKPEAYPAERVLDCGESGSTLRFFIPLALDGRGPVRFIGHGRLMQRPLDVYESMFCGMRWEKDGNSLLVEGKLTSGEFSLRGDVSSQFITGLLLALPQLPGDSVIRITTPLESRAYVELTRRVQTAFGVISQWQDENTLLIPGGQTPVSPGQFTVESDWSHAAFFLTAGAISSRGPLHVMGVDATSAQGDRAIVDILLKMGANICTAHDGIGLSVFPSRLSAIDVDVSQVPDLVPILAVAMAAADGESRIRGAARLRIKESDRLSAMTQALSAAGVDVEELPDGLIIRGGKRLHSASIDGCNDHRIVMAMAVAAQLLENSGALKISASEAVAKSAPRFWEEYRLLCCKGGEDLL